MTVVYSNNFEAETVGALPADWTTPTGAATVTSSSPVKGAKSIGLAGATDGYLAIYGGQAALGDQSVALCTRIEVIGGAGITMAQPIARSNAAGTQHYLALASTSDVVIYRANGGYSQIASAAHGLSLSASQLVWLRLECSGTTIRARIWADGASEPSTWTASVTEASFATGRQGVRFGVSSGGGQSRADEFSVDNLTVPDVTPPTLTTGVGTATGTTTGTVGATTNESNGTMYAVVTTSATPPTAAQVIAGQNNSGTAAVWSGNQAISTTGAKTFGATGLTPSTTYYGYIVHRDAAANDSTVLATPSFTTSASDSTAPTLTGPSGTQTGSSTANLGVTTNEANGTLSYVVTTSATAPSVAQVRAGQDAAGAAAPWSGSQSITTTGAKTASASGLSASTTYYAHFQHRDAASNDSAVVSSASFTTASGPTTYPVTDPSIYWSPYNWYSNGGGAMQANNVKASSTFALCNMRGGYLKFRAAVGASGSVALNLDTTGLASIAAAGCPQVAWSINGGAYQSTTLTSGQTTLALASGLSAGTYEVFAYFRGVYITQDGNSAQNYSSPNNVLKVTGIVISAGGTLSATTIRTKKLLVYGDSITEGDLSNGGPRSATSQDAHLTYGYVMAQALDAEVGIVGFYGKTWSWLDSSWTNYYAGASRLAAGALTPAPDFVVINYGENDGNPGPASATVAATLSAISAAAPSAKMVLNIPFAGTARTNLTAAALPSNCVRVDLARYEMASGATVWSYDGQHPNQRGHANLGAMLAAAITAAAVGATTRTVTLTLTTDGSTPAAGLSGLKWAFRDSFSGEIMSQGSTGSTDGSGVFTASVSTTLTSGGTGWLEVSNSDGTTTQAGGCKGYSGPAQVS